MRPHLCALQRHRLKFVIISALACSFLLSTLDRDSYIRFGIWSACCLALYLLFSVHSIAYHHNVEKIPQYK